MPRSNGGKYSRLTKILDFIGWLEGAKPSGPFTPAELRVLAEEYNRSANKRLGENHQSSKLKTADVVQIKTRLAAGEKVMEVAAAFEKVVSSPAVYKIARGSTWKDVEPQLVEKER